MVDSGETGDLGDALDRIVGGALAQLAPANGVLFQPGLVVPIREEDQVDDTERESGVGGWIGLNVEIGGAGRAGAARIDDDDIRSLALRFTQEGYEVR